MCISLLSWRLGGGSLTSHGEMRTVLELLDAAAGLCVSEGRLSVGGFLLVVQRKDGELLRWQKWGWEGSLVRSSGKRGGSSEYRSCPTGREWVCGEGQGFLRLWLPCCLLPPSQKKPSGGQVQGSTPAATCRTVTVVRC